MSNTINTSYTPSPRPGVNPGSKSAVIKKRDTNAGDGRTIETLSPRTTSEVPTLGKTIDSPAAKISDDERNYFQQLFPTAAEEMKTYNPYQKSGSRTGGQIGRLIDMKG